MELQFLFTVEQAFQISGRGCVLVPGIPSFGNLPAIRVGDRIRLTKPDGRSLDTKVQGVELINYGARKPPEKISVPISLPAEIYKHDVPAGTQVHYLGRGNEKTSQVAARHIERLAVFGQMRTPKKQEPMALVLTTSNELVAAWEKEAVSRPRHVFLSPRLNWSKTGEIGLRASRISLMLQLLDRIRLRKEMRRPP